MKRLLSKLLKGLLLTLVVSIALIIFILTTESGLQLSVILLKSFLPGELVLTEIHGNWLSHVQISQLNYISPTLHLRLAHIQGHWHFKPFSPQWVIEDLKAQDIHLKIINQEATSSKPPIMTTTQFVGWLKYLEVKSIELNNFKITDPKQPLFIGHQLLLRENKGYYLLSLNSLWQAKPLNLNAQFELKEKDLMLDTLTATFAGAKLVAHGRIQEEWSMAWQLYIPQLAVISPSLKGKINFIGRITGPRNLPLINAQWGVEKLNLSSLTIEQLNGDVTIAGTLEKPQLVFQAKLNQASIFFPNIGLQLSNIHLDLDYSKELKFSGEFDAGKGQGQIEGILAVDPLNLELQLKGKSLQVTNTPEYQIEASPNLHLNFKNQIYTIVGEVLIDEAKITPTDFSTTVTLPSEVVIVDNHSDSSASSFKSVLNIDFILKNKIDFKYKNLKTALQGKIKIIQNLGNPPTGIGELTTTNGSYQAYGKTLIIDRGRLIYTGNLLTNPGLDIRAIKKIQSLGFIRGSSAFNTQVTSSAYMGQSELRVGMNIQGTLNKPMTTLFSEPAGLSQGDILSYLIFGYPQAQASGAASGTLLDIASGVITQNKESSNPITHTLGLNELDIGTTEYFDPNSNLPHSAKTANIGKNIGHNLSIRYSIGLFDPISILILHYQLNKYFAVQSETSAQEYGGDFLYQIESAN